MIANHIIGYVFSGQTTTVRSDVYEQPLFRSFWGEAQTIFEEAAFKGSREILGLLQQPDYFVESYDFTSTY